MKQLFTPATLILALIAVIALGGWRSKARSHSLSQTELTAASNHIAELNVKLSEAGALQQTLRVQSDLQKTDLSSFTNRLNDARARLAEAATHSRTLEAQVGSAGVELRAANSANGELQAQVASLQSELAALQQSSRTLQLQLVETETASLAIQAALNAAELDRVALRQKLSDPATLRAQLVAALRATAIPGASTNDSAAARIVLTADGGMALAKPATSESR